MTPPRQRIDPQYSDDDAQTVPWAEAEARLARAELAWVVTVRPDGRPHATPMVPVVHDGKIYFHTGRAEVKTANLEANPRVLVLAGDTAWDAGLDVEVTGVAALVTDEATLRRVAERYRERWDGRWELDVKSAASPDRGPAVFVVEPTSAHAHAKGDPFGQTNYRFATATRDTPEATS